MSALFGRIVNRVMAMPVVRIAKTQVEFYAKAMSELIFLRLTFNTFIFLSTCGALINFCRMTRC